MLSGLKSRKFEASAIAVLLVFVCWGCLTKDAEASMAMQKRAAGKRAFVVTVRITVVFPKSYGPANEKAFASPKLLLSRRLSVGCGGCLLLFRSGRGRLGGQGLQAKLPAQLGFEFGSDVFIVFEELLGVFASLANALALVAEPGAGFLHHVPVHAEIDQVAF